MDAWHSCVLQAAPITQIPQAHLTVQKYSSSYINFSTSTVCHIMC